jgi:hypothetical protein
MSGGARGIRAGKGFRRSADDAESFSARRRSGGYASPGFCRVIVKMTGFARVGRARQVRAQMPILLRNNRLQKLARTLP